MSFLENEQKIKKVQKKLNQNMLNYKKSSSFGSCLDLKQLILEAIKGKDKKKVYQLIMEELKLKSGILNDEVIKIIKQEYILFLISITEKIMNEKLIETEKAFTLLNVSVQAIQLSQREEETVHIVLASAFEYIKYIEEQERKSAHYLIVFAKEYIHRYLNQKISIGEMAKEIGTNSSYLSRLFHEKEGITLQQYICNQRIKQAQKLLCSSNYTNEEISKTLGFSSLSYFGKILKDCTGMTPTQYRMYIKRSGVANQLQ